MTNHPFNRCGFIARSAAIEFAVYGVESLDAAATSPDIPVPGNTLGPKRHRFRNRTMLSNFSLHFRSIFLVTIVALVFLGPSALSQEPSNRPLKFDEVRCEGDYQHHLQGVCTDDEAAIYWSFTTQLVKTDRQGQIVKQIPVANHHGDLCFLDGKIFVAVNLGRHEFDCSLGIVGVAKGRLLFAKGPRTPAGRCTGSLHLAGSDSKMGLVAIPH